ncbi:MAG: RluA family pseudouridine synthase [Sphingomonadaceae bacterium]
MKGEPIAEDPDTGDTGSVRKVVLSADMAGWRLDRALATMLPTLSRERLKALVSAGEVSLNGRLLRDPALKVKGGEEIVVRIPDPRPAAAQAEDIPLHIVFEDEHLLIVDKPAGMVVHPAAGNLDGTLVNALLHHCHGRLSGIGGVARPGIVHRIDKGTSGLLVVAKTDRAHAGLAAQFARHTIGRSYLAVVAGLPTPPAGRIETNLARSDANRQKVAVVRPPKGKRAITHYRLMQALKRAAMVECRLETGRTHQVRVHMAHLGYPLVGDPVYGQGRFADICRELDFHRQALHAQSLRFLHPVTGAEHYYESDVPEDIQALVSRLLL